MKKMKKLASLLLALVMVLSMAMNVSAANDTVHTIKIKYEKDNHVYEAYQVFAGDYYKEGDTSTLSNVTWGTGVDGAALLAALKTADSAKYGKCNSAADVADVVAKFTNNSAEVDAFADVVGKYLTAAKAVSTKKGTEKVGDKTYYKYEIDVTGDGYYLVKDQNNSLTNSENDAYTKYILQVVGDVDMTAKAEAPELTKKIVEGEARVDANNGSVGDIVEYELKSKVPVMDGYEKYFFVVHDTLSNGLTLNYNADDKTGFEIKIGNTTLVNGTDYSVVPNGQSFKIVFNNFIQYKQSAGAEITIRYSATINENATIGNLGNPNQVYLEYSNNPNVVPGGGNEPGENDVTGKTPTDYVITYVAAVKIYKVDENGQKLTGAEFELTGESVNKVHVQGQAYVEDADGTYYKLKDGTFTETVPTDATAEKYDSTSVKYAMKSIDKWVETKNNEKASGYVDGDGNLVFEGLGEGTYEITETKAPDGYNKLDEPIIVKITFVAPENVSSGDVRGGWIYEYSFDGEKFTTTSADDAFKIDRVSITVINNKGATLPETGGMGTTIFYILGTILVLGAAVLFVTKKRMNSVK